MKILSNQKGIMPWWVIVVMLLACGFMLTIYLPKEKEHNAEKIKQALQQPHIETAAENLSANEAEKQPDIKVPPGLWTTQPKDNYKMELALGADTSFRATVEVTYADKLLLRESAAGNYHVKGGTIVFNVKEGAKGIFPNTGRVTARLHGKDQLILTADTDMTFFSAEGFKVKTAEDEKRTATYMWNNAPMAFKLGVTFAFACLIGLLGTKIMRSGAM